MINVQKVKKDLGKCWKFFAAKPAYAGIFSKWQCQYCRRTVSVLFSPSPDYNGPCQVTGRGHGWVQIG